MTARIQNTAPQPGITAGVQHLFKEVYSGAYRARRSNLVLTHLGRSGAVSSWTLSGMDL